MEREKVLVLRKNMLQVRRPHRQGLKKFQLEEATFSWRRQLTVCPNHKCKIQSPYCRSWSKSRDCFWAEGHLAGFHWKSHKASRYCYNGTHGVSRYDSNNSQLLWHNAAHCSQYVREPLYNNRIGGPGGGTHGPGLATQMGQPLVVNAAAATAGHSMPLFGGSNRSRGSHVSSNIFIFMEHHRWLSSMLLLLQ